MTPVSPELTDDLVEEVTSEWKRLLKRSKRPCGEPLEDDDPQDCREED